MKLIYNLIFFYVPFRIYKRDGVGNEVLVFVKCALLLIANIVALLILYSLVTDSFVQAPDYSRSRGKTIALLSLIPFALFYLVNRNRYKKKFAEFEQFSAAEKVKWNLYSTIYIYGSIVLLVLSVLYPILFSSQA